MKTRPTSDIVGELIAECQRKEFMERIRARAAASDRPDLVTIDVIVEEARAVFGEPAASRFVAALELEDDTIIYITHLDQRVRALSPS